LPGVSSYPNESALVADVNEAITEGATNAGKAPRVIIIGALRGCGTSAVDICPRTSVPDGNVLKWDLVETSKGGPFPEVVECDIFNCIYLMTKILNFVDTKSLDTPDRKLWVICDISRKGCYSTQVRCADENGASFRGVWIESSGKLIKKLHKSYNRSVFGM
jgi:saccharopine dehydrogenase (NAD+, L-lysine-forming)